MAIVRRNPVALADFAEVVPQQCHIAFVFTKLNLVAWRDIRALVQRRATVFAYNPDKTAVYAGFVVTATNWRKVAEIAFRVFRMRGVFVNIPGTDIETMNDVSPWIHCWLESFAFQNKDEYCCVYDYNPEVYGSMTQYRDYLADEVSDAEWRLTLPCRNAQPRHLSSDRPERFRQLCIDSARAEGCDRCPLFDIARFRAETVKRRRVRGIHMSTAGGGFGVVFNVKEMLESPDDE